MSEPVFIMIVSGTTTALLETMLNDRGYKVAAFPRGDMAVDAAESSPPDLILLDIEMPGMSGFEIYRKMKETNVENEVPVIFMSALNDWEGKARVFSEGGADFITKPFQKDEVYARVDTQIKLLKMQKEIKHYNERLEALVQEKVQEISDSQLSTLSAITKLAELRDVYTGKHIERTQIFCQMLAMELRDESVYDHIITDAYIRNIYHAAALHDVGKIGISDQLLLKTEELKPFEFDIIKKHVDIGKRALREVLNKNKSSEIIKLALELTASHHEKWDGSGYPEGLYGPDIPLSARIMALVDVYDALRSKRPYKEPLSHEESVHIIRDNGGLHFDPSVVKAFTRVESRFADIYDTMKEDGPN
jgi:putative two-component system response regulator